MIRRLLAAILAALVVIDVWRWLRGEPVPAAELEPTRLCPRCSSVGFAGRCPICSWETGRPWDWMPR